MNKSTFEPQKFFRVAPPPGKDRFIAPIYVNRRTGCEDAAAAGFMTALVESNLPDLLMSNPATARFVSSDKKCSQIKVGLRSYSPGALAKYHHCLLHFLSWCELRGSLGDAHEKFAPAHLNAYRDVLGETGSLEEYQRDQMEDRIPGLRSTSPQLIQIRVAVANAYLCFRAALDYPQTPFRPFKPTANKNYLRDDELRPSWWEIPEVETLAAWVRSLPLRDRAAAGLMVFGGLRKEEVLWLRRRDVPTFMTAKLVGDFRVELPVFGKGAKWRVTTIPRWVHADLIQLNGPWRRETAKKIEDRGNLPMGSGAPLFPSTNRPKIGSALTDDFLKTLAMNGPIKTPHNGRRAFSFYRLVELISTRAQALLKTPMTALVEAGLVTSELETLRLELGHENTDTTSIYLRYASSRLATDDQFLGLLKRIRRVHEGAM